MGWFSDVGNAVASAASAVGDVVEDVIDTVTDTVDDAADAVADAVEDAVDGATEWIEEHLGGVAGRVADVVGGAISGFVRGVASVVKSVANIWRDVGAIIGSLLRLDFAGVLRGIGELVGHAIGFFVNFWRLLIHGFVVGGIIRQWRRSSLRSFVSDLLEERFGHDPERLNRMKANVGLDGGSFGLPMKGEHRVCYLDSANTDLAGMHKRGELDLYQMAGLLSFQSFDIFPNPRNWVAKVSNVGDEDYLINRTILSEHISSNGESHRIRVFALTGSGVAKNLKTSIEKFKQLGIKLEWNDPLYFSNFRDYSRHEITASEFTLSQSDDVVGPWLISQGLRHENTDPSGNPIADPADDKTLLALSIFKFKKFGQVYGRDIDQTDPVDNPSNPGRDDGCGSAISRSVAKQDVAKGSAVVYRDVWPSWIFQYVMTHEGGHYVGLCHRGHGLKDIMWTVKEGADTNTINWGLLEYYTGNELHFSYGDAKNCWRFLVDQMPHVIEGQ